MSNVIAKIIISDKDNKVIIQIFKNNEVVQEWSSPIVFETTESETIKE